MTSVPEGSSSLVVWGTTGGRLQFSKDDLHMPDHIKDLPNIHFYEKQWSAVASFWMNRVLKETALQHLSVADIVKLIEEDIAKRWQSRRAEQLLYKRRKRLLAPNGPAGEPSSHILLTNVTSLEDYVAAGEETRNAMLSAIAQRVSSLVKERVSGVYILVDEADAAQNSPAMKRVRKEADGGVDKEKAEKPEQALFDDRVAVVGTLSSAEKAATVIAQLHGAQFDGRTVMCRFWRAS